MKAENVAKSLPDYMASRPRVTPVRTVNLIRIQVTTIPSAPTNTNVEVYNFERVQRQYSAIAIPTLHSSPLQPR
jgi:hypothetical protein